MNQMRSIRTMLTTVSAVRDVHPHLRLITFRGGDLDTFSPLGADTFLYVLLPPPGRDELTIDQSFTWELSSSMPETERPVGAYYTLRAWRPTAAGRDGTPRARHALRPPRAGRSGVAVGGSRGAR